MDDSDDNRRTIAACEQCGSLYAALELSEDKIRPIGRRDGCRCGGTDFTAVDDSLPDLSLEESDE
ncbi:hypothetical protein CP556_12675 [Natrinema sp. CBA1119]|uniref:hypothetical protein n=1 Tax=Natrinema sp. CBA1119 TaxID=1608465 RepID=UPI000BF2547D|nr:hypothetical protein [Natrinema sp. CBA1119]PGF16889.1 hypothetical protein CP556_12675 [Natrinema sp. CBA1119]